MKNFILREIIIIVLVWLLFSIIYASVNPADWNNRAFFAAAVASFTWLNFVGTLDEKYK